MGIHPQGWRLTVHALLCGAMLALGCGSKSETSRSREGDNSVVSTSGTETGLAPGFSLLGVDGVTHKLSDYNGRVVFLDFWATWCPPCQMSLPEVEKLYAAYQGKPVQILGMNLDENPDRVTRFVQKKKIPYPILRADQTDVPSAYDVAGIPHFALIDQRGRLVKTWSGFSPEMVEEWRRAIDSLLRG